MILTLRTRLVMALVIVQMPVAFAEQVVAAPIQAGDSWVYQLTEDRGVQPARVFEIQMTAARRDDAGNWLVAQRSAKAPAGSISVFTGAVDSRACMVDVPGARTLMPASCGAPVAVGAAWTVPVNLDKVLDVKVLGREQLVVPAGTFDTVKLDASERLRAGAPASLGSWYWLSHSILWYAPALGSVVRSEKTSRHADGRIFGPNVEVLESFAHAGAEPVSTNRIAAPADLGSRAPVMAQDCQPPYPEAAARGGATGVSRVRLAIDAEGHPTDTELIGASGTTREHRLLDDAARESLARCTFEPATSEGGKAMASTFDVSFNWKLR